MFDRTRAIMRRCGGIGRRTALKMRRETMPVRVRPPALDNIPGTMRPGDVFYALLFSAFLSRSAMFSAAPTNMAWQVMYSHSISRISEASEPYTSE